MRKKRQLAQEQDDLHDLHSDDRLSRFSDDVLVSIISRLPVKDAVVTSLLSRRWMYLWCQTVRLEFQDKDRSKKATDLAQKNKFINWVNYVIRHHKRSNIDEFKIRFDLGKDAKGAIGKWIEFAISKNVQKLELDFRRRNGVISVGWGSGHYVFPNKIFDRKRGSSSSNVPTEIKFLKTLVLKCVCVNDEGLKKILSNCPVLEHISVVGCRKLVKAQIHGKKLTLKSLEIKACVDLEFIELCDSNIVSFTLKTPRISGVRLDNLQKLENVYIGDGYSPERIYCLLSKISCGVPNLQVLELDIYCLPVPNPFPELLELKQLVVTVGARDTDSLLSLTSFVEACPNLQRFKVQLIWSIWVRPENTDWETRQMDKQPHEHLEVVEMVGYRGRSNDFRLAMYFIQKSVALKKLVIDPRDPDFTRASHVTTELDENNGRCHAYQQLKPRMPVGAELVIL